MSPGKRELLVFGLVWLAIGAVSAAVLIIKAQYFKRVLGLDG